MKLSIVIPIYNAERYIDECLSSIFTEADGQIELLLLDDGSTDNSWKKIQEYKGDNVHLFHHENHGVAYTRNCGIYEATGDYIMFIDADDKLTPGWKNTILSKCTTGDDVVYFGKNIAANNPEIKKLDIINSIFGIIDVNSFANMSSPCSKLYRREFLVQKNIEFPEGIINGEDALFNLGVILKAATFSCYGDSFYLYRIYGGSSSKKFSEKFFDSNLHFFKLAESLLNEGDLTAKETSRCMAYSVVYSMYLYLVLASGIKDRNSRKISLGKINTPAMEEYIHKYSTSADCNKLVRLVYWLVRHGRIVAAMQLVYLRNKVQKQRHPDMRWEQI